MVLNKLLIISIILPIIFTFESKKENRQIFDEWRNTMEQDHVECRKTTGATEEEINTFYRVRQMSNTHNLKCYFHCMYKTFKFLNEDGTFNRDEIVKGIDKVTTQMVEFCETKIIGEKDGCEKASKMVDCLVHYEHVYD